jgi:hypothetical protein
MALLGSDSSFASALALGLCAAGLLAGCGGASEATVTKKGPSPDAGTPATTEDAGTPDQTNDASSSSSDATTTPPPGNDASPPPPPDDADAAARNATCTPLSAQTGTAVDTSHGRLDGTLVYVVPTGGPGKCNGDDSHVHLQVEVSSLIYDVAVDIGAAGDQVGMYQQTIALPGGAWAEGWHGADTLAYPKLGLSVGQFPIAAPATIAANVQSLLESTSKISVFCTSYTTDNGCHDVHYENGNGNDGAIVLDPTAATPTILFFRFEGQTF